MKKEIDESYLNDVSGGGFNFYTRQGENLVYINGIGTFYYKEGTPERIIEMSMENKDINDIVNQAIANGLIWK